MVVRCKPKMCYLCTKSQEMSKVKALYHIVINTKNRKMTIGEGHCEDLQRIYERNDVVWSEVYLT